MTDTIRDAFEAWFQDLFDDQPLWDAVRNCYIEHSIHLAWKGWQAATEQGKRQPLSSDAAMEMAKRVCGVLHSDVLQMNRTRIVQFTRAIEAAITATEQGKIGKNLICNLQFAVKQDG